MKALRAVAALLLTAALLTGAASAAASAPSCWQEWPEGSAAADALRERLGTDAALVSTGALRRPEDCEFAAARVTGAQMWQLLEQSVSRVSMDYETERVLEAESDFDGFCQVSGLRFAYDASAPSGSRLLWARLDDGTELAPDDGAALTLAAPRALLEALSVPLCGDGCCRLSQLSWDGKPDGGEPRIVVAGVRTGRLAGGLTRRSLLAGCVFLMAAALFFSRKLRKRD